MVVVWWEMQEEDGEGCDTLSKVAVKYCFVLLLRCCVHCSSIYGMRMDRIGCFSSSFSEPCSASENTLKQDGLRGFDSLFYRLKTQSRKQGIFVAM